MGRSWLSGQQGMVVLLLLLLTENTSSRVSKRTTNPAESGVGPNLPENLFISLVVV